MKNYKKFCELFNVPITYYKEFDYYINLLSESREWNNLKNWVSSFEHFEEIFPKPVDEIYSQRARIISYLEKFNFKIPDHFTKSGSQQITRINKNNEIIQKFDSDGNPCYYISFDLIKANYQTLVYFNNILNDNPNKLGKWWEEFCEELHIHHVVYESKQLRQEILGHFNPKATAKFQNEVLLDFIKINKLDPRDLREGEKELGTIVFLSTDEVILEVKKEDIVTIYKKFETDFSIFIHRYSNFDWIFKQSIFTYEQKGFKQYYKLNLQDSLEEDYLKLFKIPKKYYIYHFVKTVLKREPNELDRLFVEDNMLQNIVDEMDT